MDAIICTYKHQTPHTASGGLWRHVRNDMRLGTLSKVRSGVGGASRGFFASGTESRGFCFFVVSSSGASYPLASGLAGMWVVGLGAARWGWGWHIAFNIGFIGGANPFSEKNPLVGDIGEVTGRTGGHACGQPVGQWTGQGPGRILGSHGLL